jgi:transcriptional regulator with XRE-family HTH domain
VRGCRVENRARQMRITRLRKVALLRLGRRIRRARKLWSLSDAVLAAECGLDKDYFCQIECGVQDVLFSELCQICEALRCDIAAMTKGIPHPLS